MSATIYRLRTERQRLRSDQAAELRQLVLEFTDLPSRARGEIIAAIDGQTASENGWTFVMISPAEHCAVVHWLSANSKRPQKAVLLWAELFTALRTDTGEIMLTRDELAERVGLRPEHVSAIMTELETLGAVTRWRERTPGMRGPGPVRYAMNPRVGTHLAGRRRDEAQAEAVQLRLV